MPQMAPHTKSSESQRGEAAQGSAGWGWATETMEKSLPPEESDVEPLITRLHQAGTVIFVDKETGLGRCVLRRDIWNGKIEGGLTEH